MTLREALLSAGFTVEGREDDEMLVEHCQRPASWTACFGGIFGPDRVWCRECGAEVRQRRGGIDEYGVEVTGADQTHALQGEGREQQATQEGTDAA